MDVLEGIVELARASKITVWQLILKWFTRREWCERSRHRNVPQ